MTRGSAKKAFYARIAENLAKNPGLRKEDVLMNLVKVPKKNWSFGNGIAERGVKRRKISFVSPRD